ncbi:hypothetical protein Tco_0300323 [Tanacetum coccineum]
MKKLKNYVQNKAKPKGSIAEGYVAEEALTFCSRYLNDDVEMRFNRLGRNDDGLPKEEPDKFEVFRSVCKPIGRMKESRLTTDVIQAVVCGVSTPELDGEMYYGQLEEILELTYIGHRKTTTWLEGRRTRLSSRCGRVRSRCFHGSSSSYVTLSVGLTCLEHTNLSINAQSTEVDTPPINDDNANANEDNVDFINNEDDVVAHVLDDDDVVMSDDDEVNPSTNVEEVLSSDDSDDDN